MLSKLLRKSVDVPLRRGRVKNLRMSTILLLCITPLTTLFSLCKSVMSRLTSQQKFGVQGLIICKLL
jgi:hypothetical protein